MLCSSTNQKFDRFISLLVLKLLKIYWQAANSNLADGRQLSKLFQSFASESRSERLEIIS